MNDTETIQRERGWRECVFNSRHHWHQPGTLPCGENLCSVVWEPSFIDPLADTPEGWYEFGQIIKWAHEKGWAFVLEIAAHHYCAMVNSAAGWMGNGYGDFRTAIIAALAAAVRPESEAKG